jgi:hypothetical protein
MRRELRTEPVKDRPLRLLIMTAKIPGFTPEQVEITYQSLEDLRDYLSKRADIQVVWRVTRGLHQRLGVKNTFKEASSKDLLGVLGAVDAVITTPSTAMLEGMLLGHPVALLDYHNCPHYIDAAWSITCPGHIASVIDELKTPPLGRMLYQDYCLHDALSCRSPALPRMISLIEEMLRLKKENDVRGSDKLEYPHRILDHAEEIVSWPSKHYDMEVLFPNHPVFGRSDLLAMQAELDAALGTINQMDNQINILTNRLHRIPGYLLAKRVVKRLRS